MDVGLAVNSHGGNAHFSGGTHDAHRNFAAVGDKQFGDRTDAGVVFMSRWFGCPKIGRWVRAKGHEKRASDSCRTATTAYPCCLPALGDSAGAGRKRLAPAQRYARAGPTLQTMTNFNVTSMHGAGAGVNFAVLMVLYLGQHEPVGRVVGWAFWRSVIACGMFTGTMAARKGKGAWRRLARHGWRRCRWLLWPKSLGAAVLTCCCIKSLPLSCLV